MQDESLLERHIRLAEYKGPDRVISSTEMREQLSKEKKVSYSFSTGLYHLDVAIDKIETGELIALGGPTKHGKTLLAQTLTAHLSKAAVRCLWFTFEVPPRQFLSQVSEDVVFYMPQKLELYRINWVEERIEEAKLKHDVRVVFIDNLHHVFDIACSKNPSMDIGVVIRSLKRMVVNLNVSVFLLCHSKKPSDTRGVFLDVSEWDLRDSSFIPQESDSTWMIQREFDIKTKKFIPNQAILKICNHRRTGIMLKKIYLRKSGLFFEEDFERNERGE